MKELLRTTTAYRAMREPSHATLTVFPDAKYLRALLKECAKAFFQSSGRTERLIDSETFSDCIVLPAEGNKLTADDAARIIDESALRPVEEDKKLFVLDAFDAASALVQNKLLKVVEEPPEGVYFLIGATGESAVLPTVLSRVRKLTVAPFSEETVLKALQRNHAGEEGLRRAAAASGGVYSLAEELVGDGEDFRLALALFQEEALEETCRMAGDRKDKKAFFAALRLTVRDMLLFRTGQRKYAALGGKEIEACAGRYSAGALLNAAELITEAERETGFNANFAQCLYVYALRVRERKG